MFSCVYTGMCACMSVSPYTYKHMHTPTPNVHKPLPAGQQRKRRHSLSSTRNLSTEVHHHLAKSKQTDTNKSSTLDRRRHRSTNQEPKSGSSTTKTGRNSFFKIFRSKSTRHRSQRMEVSRDMEENEKVRVNLVSVCCASYYIVCGIRGECKSIVVPTLCLLSSSMPLL